MLYAMDTCTNKTSKKKKKNMQTTNENNYDL